MEEIRIMVVDDFHQWRTTLQSIVDGINGCRFVGDAENALEAIEKVALLHPDIVLLDIGLPTLNGIEAASRIQKASPHSRIIFVTQDLDSETKAAALATGAEGYLLKSRVFDELEPAIKTALKIGLSSPSFEAAAVEQETEIFSLPRESPAGVV